MTKKKVIHGLMERFDWYKGLIESYPEETHDKWFAQLQEVFTTAMWIDAISTEQYGILSEMLTKVRFGEE